MGLVLVVQDNGDGDPTDASLTLFVDMFAQNAGTDLGEVLDTED
jgi:hypothetical protein